MPILDLDLSTLARLRSLFLQGTAGSADYWKSDADLTLYHRFFAERIRWKWNFVLSALHRLSWQPPDAPLLDWGCGTGVAASAFLESFSAYTNIVSLYDRSPMAREFAAHTIRSQSTTTAVSATATPTPTNGIVLISHVLTELNEAALQALLSSLRMASVVIWVEPGAKDVAQRLVSVREQLKNDFAVVAPCTHQGACGLLTKENARHWCHHFAEPPREVFMNSEWSVVVRELGIDLRATPLSFLVLDNRAPKPLPDKAFRVIGSPRLHKADADLFLCHQTGVRDYRITKREQPELFKAIKKETLPSLITDFSSHNT
jgi:hypothetical protein